MVIDVHNNSSIIFLAMNNIILVFTKGWRGIFIFSLIDQTWE